MVLIRCKEQTEELVERRWRGREGAWRDKERGGQRGGGEVKEGVQVEGRGLRR